MIEKINTYINVYNLIGLSLSQCCTDWIKRRINLNQIDCLFSGTAIQKSSINEWIKQESIVNPTINAMPSMAKDFIYHLIDYDKLMQPRLMNNGMVPVYRGQPINWIHRDRWIDWNVYQSSNQMCPYCGLIGKYDQVGWTMGTMSQSELRQLKCNQCDKEWTIEINSKWPNYNAA